MPLIQNREFDGFDEYRYRVVEVTAVYDNTVSAAKVWEYKDYDAADERHRALVAEGKSALFQVGQLKWLTPEEQDVHLDGRSEQRPDEAGKTFAVEIEQSPPRP